MGQTTEHLLQIPPHGSGIVPPAAATAFLPNQPPMYPTRGGFCHCDYDRATNRMGNDPMFYPARPKHNFPNRSSLIANYEDFYDTDDMMY